MNHNPEHFRKVLLFMAVILLLLVFAFCTSQEVYGNEPTSTPELAAATATQEHPVITPKPTITFMPATATQEPITPPAKPTITFMPATATQEPITPPPKGTEQPTIPVPDQPLQYQSETVCFTYFIRPWGIKMIPRCWVYVPRITTPIPIFVP